MPSPTRPSRSMRAVQPVDAGQPGAGRVSLDRPRLARNRRGSGMGSLERVLIANRGEIAIRIAKAAAGLGMTSVAVAAPADADSLHTRLATEWRTLDGGTPGDPVSAYLDAEALVRIARETGCDCVHPGYGFLAENAAFAERCAAA